MASEALMNRLKNHVLEKPPTPSIVRYRECLRRHIAAKKRSVELIQLAQDMERESRQAYIEALRCLDIEDLLEHTVHEAFVENYDQIVAMQREKLQQRSRDNQITPIHTPPYTVGHDTSVTTPKKPILRRSNAMFTPIPETPEDKMPQRCYDNKRSTTSLSFKTYMPDNKRFCKTPDE